MSSWQSVELEVLYIVLGWMAFATWSLCFYPQIVLNFRRKSVVGLNFDYVLLNFFKQIAYLFYNLSLFFSPIVQKQYYQKFGYNQMLPVAQSDVAFSIHIVFTSSLVMFQICIYDRGNQRVSKTCMSFMSMFFLAVVVCTSVAIPRHAWLWLVSCFNTMQAVMTIIKYIPQIVLNFQRKSTTGFSIGNVLLDLVGGLTNCLAMGLQSLDQNSLENMYGNLGKLLLSFATVILDAIFMFQHFVLYPNQKPPLPEGNVELSRDIEAR